MSLNIFALNGSREFGTRVTESLDMCLSRHEEHEFADGEHNSFALDHVRGNDVFVVHSLYSDEHASVNDKLVRLLMFVGALKDASAARVTVVIPYLCYSRKDRKTNPRDPISTKYIAQMIESVGTDRVVTLDIHNLSAFQNAFRIQTDHLDANTPFVSYFSPQLNGEDVVVVSPDAGGMKRAERFRQTLAAALNSNITTAFMEKHRHLDELSGGTLIGDVRDRNVIIIDDMISSGGTIARTVKACSDARAALIQCATTHGLFVDPANEILADAHLNQIIITNTVPPFRLTSKAVRDKLTTLDVAPLFASAIRCIHNNESIEEIL